MLFEWCRIRNRPRVHSLFGNLIANMQARLEEHPADMRLRLSLASHLEKAGRFEEAVGEVRRILHHNPDYPQAKSMLWRLKLERRLAGLSRVQ